MKKPLQYRESSGLSRKEFIKLLAFAGGSYALSTMLPDSMRKELLAATIGSTGPFLVNVVLDGGPDMRHLVVPRPSSVTTEYGNVFWRNRYSLFGALPFYDSWMSAYSSQFQEVSGNNGNPNFGIHRNAGWLITQYQAGNVAFVNNVAHSDSRDHARSLLVIQSGNYDTPAYQTSVDGWGGKLLEQMGASDRILSMTYDVKPFCNRDASKIISFRDSRDFGLYEPSSNQKVNWNGSPATSSRAVMWRAIRSYYNKKSFSGSYAHYQTHYNNLRDLTAGINTRQAANPLPLSISRLTGNGSTLNSPYWGGQMQSLYDAYVCSDLLGFRIASLNYGGWDTHKWQQREIEARISDIFGSGMGLASVYGEFSNALANSVLVFYGDFGRQLQANGAASTDHGNANTVVLIGGHVNGGTFGEMWPASESTDSGSGVKFDRGHEGIEGRTTIDQVMQSVCEYMQGGVTLSNVFTVGSPTMESGFGNIATIVS